MCSLVACGTDPENATSKHLYGENESPYLKANTNATITTNMEFPIGRFAEKIVNLKDYAEKFHTNMGMTVDDVIEGLATGKVVFYNINATKNYWNKTEKTKGATGWYYNTAGGISNIEKGVASVEINLTDKTLIVNMIGDPASGTSFAVNVGFAVNNGINYDDYVRFTFNITVTDPGRVIVSCVIPSGGYSSYSIKFDNYTNIIENNMGMALKDFSDAVTDSKGIIAMYIVNAATGEWNKTSSYTANGIGYWMTKDNNPCTYSGTDSSSSFYIETGDGCVNIGRHERNPSGSTLKTDFVYANKEDNSKFVEFIVNATME